MAKKPTARPVENPIVLRWLGGDEPAFVINGIPARDLSQWDIDRIAYVRSKGPSLPKTPVIADLIRSGLYAPAKP